MISRRYRVIGLSVWPGLPQIWAGQVAYGLILGLFFTVVFNATMLTQWVYTDLLEVGTRQMLWLLSLTMYVAMAAWTVVWVWRFHPEKFEKEIERLYMLSGESYLQGRWTESRIQLEQVVALNPSDTEALMRLARLLERTGQTDQARRALDQCRDTSGASRWVWEIEQMAQRMSVKEKSETKQLA
jgi:tetratricopeptide (TPR) repeat protein